jgi:hypothetical protein
VTTLIALTLLALAALATTWSAVRRRNVLADVERFQHARRLTTSWSADGSTAPQQHPQDDPT